MKTQKLKKINSCNLFNLYFQRGEPLSDTVKREIFLIVQAILNFNLAQANIISHHYSKKRKIEDGHLGQAEKRMTKFTSLLKNSFYLTYLNNKSKKCMMTITLIKGMAI